MKFFHTLPHYGNILPNILNRSRLLRRLFQYSVICHFSKYIRLALRDFDKNKISYRKCMWLQLRQVLKKFTEGNAKKFTVSFAICAHVDVIRCVRPSTHYSI